MSLQDLPLLIEDLTQNCKIKALKFCFHFYLRKWVAENQGKAYTKQVTDSVISSAFLYEVNIKNTNILLYLHEFISRAWNSQKGNTENLSRLYILNC